MEPSHEPQKPVGSGYPKRRGQIPLLNLERFLLACLAGFDL
jgi:hypothetical protein